MAGETPRLRDFGEDNFLFSFFRAITKRKQMEEVVVNLSKFPSENPNPVLRIGSEGTILYKNEATDVLLNESGLAEEDIFRILPDNLKKLISKALKTKKAFYDLEVVVGDKAYSYSLFPVVESQYVNLYAVDVTERKQAEELLKAEKEQAEGFLNIVRVMLAIVSADGNVALINKKGCEILGYEEGELIGKNWFDTLVPQRIRDEVRKVFHKLMAGDIEPVEYYENPLLTKDGEERLILFHNTVIRGPNGQMVGALTSGEDITERKEAEETLRESEERYKALFEGAAEGIIVADTETKEFKYVNPAICKTLGYTEEELGRLGVRDTHPKEDLEYVVSEFETQAQGEKTLSSSIPCLRKDGTIMYADITTAMVLINGRQCNVGFFTDITERKRIKAELENYKEKVLQAQKHTYISSMGAIVAHQLNQPLTKINILLDRAIEQIEEASCCPSALKNTKEGLAEAKEAASIIRKFHQYSKDSFPEAVGNVNVSAVADRIVSVLSQRATQAKMRIAIKGLGDLPKVETNETALEQIFLIIIQNAIEVADGRKKHKLDITGKFADGNIELQFADDCCGIAPENLDRIFEPFFSTKTEGEGMGLGLDIVQQILISYGGEIRVESQLGKGTTFYVTLPISNTLEG